ncbi:adenylate/guanylate cyclase domain-containing protein [Nonomuraea sp. NPDC050663]|uniref:adenylate/guanylate cyclase domain-containing protein n=1 Tax=Nonomuraea sp. NPDC050663 TaxID=3364370 RepID=UPI0037A14829
MTRPTAEEIERLFVGPAAGYTRLQVAEAAGVSSALAERLWRALGFASPTDDEVVFTEADVATLRRVRTMLDTGLLDEATAIRMARALGQTTARLAQWQAEIMIGALLPADPSDADLERVLMAAEKLLPDFEQVLVHVWRAQLAAAGTRLLTMADLTDETVPTRATLVVGFADLVSFTRRSRELGEDELAELVEGFESRAADVIAAHGARLVKTLGDEVLFTAADPEQAARVAMELVGDDMRIGLAYGPVLPMLGDVFGTTVNLASRLTALARPGTILLDSGLAEALTGFRLVRLRRRSLRGLGFVQPFVLRR